MPILTVDQGHRELQWMRVTFTDDHEAWSAKSADSVRTFTVSNDRQIIASQWQLAYRTAPDVPVEYAPYKFNGRWEAQDAAQLIENSYALDTTKLREIEAGNQLTVGGNNWKYFGVHDNKRLWICTLPGDISAYVAIQDCANLSSGWKVTKRRWVSDGKGNQILKTDYVGTYLTIEQSAKHVASLTHNSSTSSSVPTAKAPDSSNSGALLSE